MKISGINNAYSRVSFGYDKQLNEELKTRLKEYPDRKWAKTLSSMNTQCNNLEAILRKDDKNTDKLSSIYMDYLDLFLTLKQKLAGFLAVTMEDLHFADREYAHYHDEFSKNGSEDNFWPLEACHYLSEWTTTKHDDLKKTEKTQETGIEEDAMLVSEKSLLGDKSLLEEYVPTKTSPKGFIDVAGMEDLKRDLKDGILEYIIDPQMAQLDFEEYGKTIPRGILLFGPPGCGKTYITEALSAETQLPLYKLNISKAGSHYINATSKNIQAAFDEAINIAEKTKKPCLLFMDEIDTLGFDRTSHTENEDMKQVGTLLQAMDKAKDRDVIIIGATNKYNLLDPALKRRFDEQVLVDLPDFNARKDLLIKNLSKITKGKSLLESKDDLDEIAKLLTGYSNSSICTISKQAALNALRRNRADVSLDDYRKAITESNQEKPNRKEYLSDSKKNNNIGFIPASVS